MAIAVPKVLPKVSRKGSLARREAIAFYLFILPWILGFLAFTVIPILASGYLSFTEYDIANPPVWVGFGNYQHLFGDPIFRKSIRVTLTYAVMALPLGLFFSIALALLLNLKLPALSLQRSANLTHRSKGGAHMLLTRHRKPRKPLDHLDRLDALHQTLRKLVCDAGRLHARTVLRVSSTLAYPPLEQRKQRLGRGQQRRHCHLRIHLHRAALLRSLGDAQLHPLVRRDLDRIDRGTVEQLDDLLYVA